MMRSKHRIKPSQANIVNEVIVSAMPGQAIISVSAEGGTVTRIGDTYVITGVVYNDDDELGEHVTVEEV